MPPSDSSEISGSKRNHELSRRFELNDKSSKNLNVGLSQPGSFQKWASEILQLEKDVGKGRDRAQRVVEKIFCCVIQRAFHMRTWDMTLRKN